MQEIVHPKGKIYYSMGEVAELFGVNASLLRFWEEEFPILKIAKNSRGHRIYTTADVDNIRLIYYLVKEQGMTLEGAKKRIRQNRDGVNRDAEIVEHLRSIRNMLAALREELGGDTQVIEIEEEDEEVVVADKVAEDSPVAEEPTIMEEEVVAVAEAEEEAEVPAEVDDTEQFMVAEEPAAEKPEKAEKAEKAEKPAKAAKLGTLIGGNLFSPEDIRLAVAKQSAKESKKEAKNKVIEQTLF